MPVAVNGLSITLSSSYRGEKKAFYLAIQEILYETIISEGLRSGKRVKVSVQPCTILSSIFLS